jgi:hypothetical protein
MSWCQMLSTVRADDRHRISRHRTTEPGCCREAQRHASIRAALAHGPIGVCTEGQLSADERIEYETYVQALEFIAVLQAQARSLLTNGYV